MATGKTTVNTYLYFGPSSTNYMPDTMIAANTQLTVQWEESNWYYVEVLGKRNYLPKSNVSVLSGTVPFFSAAYSAKCSSASVQTYSAPSKPISGLLIPPGEFLRALNKTENTYTMVDFIERTTGSLGRMRRVWVPTNSLSTSATSNYFHYSGTYNGMLLHIIKTPASNIKIATLKREKSLSGSGEYGINGGWFDGVGPINTLQISINDNKVIYGNGMTSSDDKKISENAATATYATIYGKAGVLNEFGRGEIYYEGLKLKHKIINAWASTTFSGKAWGIGGVNLFLGNSNWYSETSKELPNPTTQQYLTDSATGRTAIVANILLDEVYLIVTPDSNTTTAFRSAIQSFFGISQTQNVNHDHYKGIFLDGGLSSQIRCKHRTGSDVNIFPNPASGKIRDLTQIIALKNKT